MWQCYAGTAQSAGGTWLSKKQETRKCCFSTFLFTCSLLPPRILLSYQFSCCPSFMALSTLSLRWRQLEDYQSRNNNDRCDSTASSQSANVAPQSESGLSRRASISSLATNKTRSDSPVVSRARNAAGTGVQYCRVSNHQNNYNLLNVKSELTI